MAEYTDLTPAPEGWRWISRPARDSFNEWAAGVLTFSPDGTTQTTAKIEQLYSTLYAWMVEWESLIQEYGEPENVGDSIYVRRKFNVFPGMNTPAHVERYWPTQWCRYGYNHGPNKTSLTCNHGAIQEQLIDAGDSRTYIGLVVWTPELNQYKDVNSVLRCATSVSSTELSRRLTTEQYRGGDIDHERAQRCARGVSAGFSACSDCEPRLTCNRCSNMFQAAYGLTLDSEFYCNTCTTFYCDNCNNWSNVACQYGSDNDGRLCAACHLTINADRYEEFDGTQDDLPAAVLSLVNNPHRPVRTCSIEVETVEGGSSLARVLAEAQLTTHSEVTGYHSSGSLSADNFCHVEHDSSLGDHGGELIFDRIRLDEPGDVSKLHQAMGLVRQQIKAGFLQVSLACGLHIHVDAHQFNVGHVRNLVLVTNYLEDVIFRLSAAKYKRHRGVGFATPLPKGPFLNRRDFGVNFFAQNGHHSSLNVEHYWNAMRNSCTCGAVQFSDAADCQCNLGKCTFEFRFFNGTANFRKVHAYASLCQSIVAYAKLVPDIDSDSFIPQEYDGRHTGAGIAKKDKWDERLRWMLVNLFFDPNERESLRYCVDHSALAELGVDRIESIFQTEYIVPNVPTQEIVHRNVRGSADVSASPFPGFSDYRTNLRRR